MKAAASKTNGWPERPLGDVLQRIESGVSPKSMDRPTVSSELGVLKVSAVTWGEFRPGENKALPVGFAADGCPRVQRGDLLLSRANTAELLASPVVVKQDYPNLLLSDKTLRLVPKAENADSLYLYYALRTAPCRRYFAAHATGTSGSMRNVSQETIRACPIPLPPLSEQRRIAAILDQADGVRRKRQAALALTDQFLRSTFLEMFGDPVRNPMGWPVVPMSHFVGELEGGKNIKTDDEPNIETRHFILKVSAVTWGEFRPSESKPVPPSFLPPPSYFVKAGDLLISRANTRELIGATALVHATPANLILPDKIWRFAWKQPHTVDAMYVHALLSQPAIRLVVGSLASGTSGSMKNISKPKLLSIRVPLPPLSVQSKFAAIVHHSRKLSTATIASSEMTDRLFDSLVHRAFSGEL